MYHRCKPSDLVFVSGSFDQIANLMEVNVYNVSDYGYCVVDRFGWGIFLGLRLTQGTWIHGCVCKCVYVSGYFHWECLDVGILFSLRWG